MKRHEYIEHTADIAIRAYGDSLEEAFASAADAMFEIITEHAVIEPRERVSFNIEAGDQESLLVAFLSRLVLSHEIDGWVLHDFSVTIEDGRHMHASASGERFDPDRHGGGLQIKGVSYHLMEIRQPVGDDPASVQVLFDI
jgi:SHS2 domain-containing protein